MNVYEAVRKHYGDGNLSGLRLFVQLDYDPPRRVSMVNRVGMILVSSGSTDPDRALYQTTAFHVYKVSIGKRSIVGQDTILHTKIFRK